MPKNDALSGRQQSGKDETVTWTSLHSAEVNAQGTVSPVLGQRPLGVFQAEIVVGPIAELLLAA